MKRRSPASLASAASQIAETLGAERMAEIVRRSPTLIYKWTDPDLDYFPNLQQALELDHAYVAAGLGAPPFLAAYATQLKQKSVAERGEPSADPLPTAAQLVTAACEILGQIADQFPTGPENANSMNRILDNLSRLGELGAQLWWMLELRRGKDALRLPGGEDISAASND